VGGVSGRAGAKAGGSNPFAHVDSFAWRDGERHPGRLEGGSLRGGSPERGPRSVRRLSWVSSQGRTRADDSGCPEDAEEGNAVGMRAQSACTRRRHERSSHAPGDASFARSFDPCMSILTMLRRRKPRRWGVRASITVGQPRETGTNQHWGSHGRTSRGSPRVTAPAREAACHVEEKEGDRGLPPCEDPGARVWLPARRNAVAEVGRRRLASNKLGKRAPKRAAGSSERGPSSERGSAGETVGSHIERKRAS